MTARNGGVLLGVVSAFAGSTETRTQQAVPGFVLNNATVIGDAPPVFKNRGDYIAGGVQETWISTPLPSTFPPSGHTLANIDHDILET